MLSHTQLSSAMQRAITLAQRGPSDDINPQVGCVIVDAANSVVAEGYHAGAGSDHAEVAALKNLDSQLNPVGLTAVVTLEPCNHTGTTPPCVEALHTAGIGTIVYGQPDVGQRSSGGATELFARGHRLIGGVESEATATLLRDWHQRTEQTRGRVIAKWAQSLDGRLAAADGSSRWITGAKARRHVHLQRALADIVVTTTATVSADNPALTARDEHQNLLVAPQDQPLPVIFGTGTVADDALVHQHPALISRGLARAPQFSGQDLRNQFAGLSKYIDATPRVFLEAGPRFTTAVLGQHLADELLIYTAPLLLGGPHHAVGELGIETLTDAHKLVFSSMHQLDADTVSTLRKDH
ncbi:bifunctional diaminohydroxyphosphoribosylaminopyrimidine deaminase/5-amino-6-(5-phosphoribosylamino)uracil reductase RibD [Yaniella halotolerans]|uniref:bifunctional diaminohydroxyphosphoribosylaminopyrimidine deaminase/5-amino-6-(5-phosphoribosylamino)uracil reductase RibD n=1 Tax=Yaniella halotolerans TaxID=225453 RepID=UPI0003B598F2|nr:bifunctional diaminohydroxyphosphoribosylaminopyrimidine deaminase/5-amino-6-(5-phosphoribosylamino)uracil reductase RibD [Yaniella halotolerans]